jgi:aminodeoxyfutalosine synthase
MNMERWLNDATIPENLRDIGRIVIEGQRITAHHAHLLYLHADLGMLGLLATTVAEKHNGNRVFFNRNFHIEPTNNCIHSCAFCSYKKAPGQEGSWELSLSQIRETALAFKDKSVTEVHITGGVHPSWRLDYFGKIIATIKEVLPSIHVKAFSAVELDFIFSKAKLNPTQGLLRLKQFGLDSIPGGGAEIADTDIRQKICGEKTSWKRWLQIHEAAHSIGLMSNATMLYGHFESYAHRVAHMADLRDLQDKTSGFNCFIPLKFRSSNNSLQHIGEVDSLEDMRNFAVARIFLDNFKHIKAYWPMLGKPATQLSLSFGVDDVDGTISDTTRIYSMAGVEEQSPSMTQHELCNLIRHKQKQPAERDSLYNTIKLF